MQSSDMNHVYVLPQLHTLLWSNKKASNIENTLKISECYEMIKLMLIGIMKR